MPSHPIAVSSRFSSRLPKVEIHRETPLCRNGPSLEHLALDAFRCVSMLAQAEPDPIFLHAFSGVQLSCQMNRSQTAIWRPCPRKRDWLAGQIASGASGGETK
jgi:hypothetical protein